MQVPVPSVNFEETTRRHIPADGNIFSKSHFHISVGHRKDVSVCGRDADLAQGKDREIRHKEYLRFLPQFGRHQNMATIITRVSLEMYHLPPGAGLLATNLHNM
jgi:hypothetical protein